MRILLTTLRESWKGPMGNKTPKLQSESVFDPDRKNISKNATAYSKSMRLTAQKKQELCVKGYVRENCADLQIPEVLLKLFALFYIVKMDKWNTEIVSYGIFIDEDRNMIETKNVGWSRNAFGSYIIKKGMINTWNLRLRSTANQQIYGNQTVANLIGIMERDKIKSSGVKGHFINPENGGYAYCTFLSDIKHDGWNSKWCKRYGEKCYYDAAVSMTLDMTQEKKESGLLSYVINGTDYGVAFDQIDIDKEYCLTVEIHSVGSIEIAEW